MKPDRADQILRSLRRAQDEIKAEIGESVSADPPDWATFYFMCDVSSMVAGVKDAVNSRREGSLTEDLERLRR